LPVFGIDSDEGAPPGDSFLTITFVRPSGRDDVALDVQTAGDLAGWESNAVWVRQEEHEDGSVLLTYRDVESIESAERRFLRLRASRQRV
jgi:hypothetical protein